MSSALLPEFPSKHRVLERLRKRVQIKESDDFFLVFGPEDDCRTAADEIRLRFADATQGVPKETRQALTGGFTTFERILPGPDRMYPDTDSPPTPVTEARVTSLKARLRPAPWERIERYMSWRVPEETCHYLIRRGGAEILDAVIEKTGVDGLVAAVEIGQHSKALHRAGVPMERLGAAEWVQIFDLFTDGRIPRECIPVVAAGVAKDGLSAEAAASAAGVAIQSRERWRENVDHLTMEGYQGERVDSPDKRLRFLAGRAMEQLRGKASAKEVAEYLRQKLAEVSQ
jgi:glutamyl-tRNA(Gln) amidotransferase subunit E